MLAFNDYNLNDDCQKVPVRIYEKLMTIPVLLTQLDCLMRNIRVSFLMIFRLELCSSWLFALFFCFLQKKIYNNEIGYVCLTICRFNDVYKIK